MVRPSRVCAVLLATALPVACQEQEPSDKEAAERVVGCEQFKANCASCHGEGGQGDGPHGEHLDPIPTDLVGVASQSRAHDERLADIRNGVGEGMPAFAELMTDEQMQSVLVYVDALAAGDSVMCSDVSAGSTGQPGTSGASNGTTTSDDSTGSGTSPTTTDPSTTDDPASTTDATSGIGSTGEDSAGVSPECEAWCGCLDTSCSEFPGYPFASLDDCYTTCVGLTEQELMCWQGFCDDVEADPPLAEHLCDHAWGALGLSEC